MENNQNKFTDQEIQSILDEQDNASKELEEKVTRIGDYVTTRDVANNFGVTISTVHRWMAIGALNYEKHNPYDRYRISTDSFNELERLVRSNSGRMLKYAGREFFGKRG